MKKNRIWRRALTAMSLAVVMAVTLCSCVFDLDLPSSHTEPPADPLETAVSTIPNFEKRIYLNQLDDRLLRDFCELYSCVSNFKKQCDFSESITEDEVDLLLLLLQCECPELFQFDRDNFYTIYLDPEDQLVSHMDMTYLMSQKDYDRCYSECETVLKNLLAQTSGKSDYEKELYVYDFIAKTCVYDNNAEYSATAYGALVDGYAKCDGISLAIKWVMETLDVPCACVAGMPLSGQIGHMWNVVEIDGIFYNLDATSELSNSPAVSPYFYPAFNVSDEWVRANYEVYDIMADNLNIPCADTMEQSFHVKNGTYVREGEDWSELLYSLFDQAYRGDGAFVIQFESDSDFNTFLTTLKSSASSWSRSKSIGSWSLSTVRYDAFRTCRVDMQMQ